MGWLNHWGSDTASANHKDLRIVIIWVINDSSEIYSNEKLILRIIKLG
jgi:hypothetical protein